MRFLDRLLQTWRIHKAAPWIKPHGRVLDVGCADGALFRRLGARIAGGVGLDPSLREERNLGSARLLPGSFPRDAPSGSFDTITLLAVLEHVPMSDQPLLATRCAELLVPGGHLVISVPQPAVDRVLDVLTGLRLLDAMSFEEHYGFDVRLTRRLFEDAGLELVTHRRFQLGLNNLFVFRRRQDPGHTTRS
jgi:2-polyprenyl-3-methyl-5-hydroxy-6-metoxy-1,4-benzoquinol methylase